MVAKTKGGENIKKKKFKKNLHLYINEGNIIAMPLCFPGVTEPIDSNDSYIKCLAVGLNNMVFGGTSGKKAHIFAASITGTDGIVFDMNIEPEAYECVGVVCTKTKIIAAINTNTGSKIVTRYLQKGFPDCVQEWSFDLTPFKTVIELPKNEIISQIIPNETGDGIIGLTKNSLFMWKENQLKLDFHNKNGIVSINSNNNNIFGIDSSGNLSSIIFTQNSVKIKEGKKLVGNFSDNIVWCNDNINRLVYLTDNNGQLFRVYSDKKVEKIGKTHLAPVTCMSATNDGRVFGFCGTGIANMFTYNPKENVIKKLGVAVSTINRRRYGYEYSCAVTGQNGEIYFGEFDRNGHLWIFFPKIVGN